MKLNQTIDLSKVNWQFCSHVSYDTCVIRTDKGEVNGKTIYRHMRTNKTKHGDFGNTKVTYSETIDSRDLTEEKIIEKMIKLAYNKKV